jgi:hypothetical protein
MIDDEVIVKNFTIKLIVQQMSYQCHELTPYVLKHYFIISKNV